MQRFEMAFAYVLEAASMAVESVTFGRVTPSWGIDFLLRRAELDARLADDIARAKR